MRSASTSSRDKLTPAAKRFLATFDELLDARRRDEHHGVDVARAAMQATLDKLDFQPSRQGPASYRYRTPTL